MMNMRISTPGSRSPTFSALYFLVSAKNSSQFPPRSCASCATASAFSRSPICSCACARRTRIFLNSFSSLTQLLSFMASRQKFAAAEGWTVFSAHCAVFASTVRRSTSAAYAVVGSADATSSALCASMYSAYAARKSPSPCRFRP